MISPQLLIDPSILKVFDRYGGYMTLWDFDTEIPQQLLQDLEKIGCAREHLDFIKTIRAQGSSVTAGLKYKFPGDTCHDGLFRVSVL